MILALPFSTRSVPFGERDALQVEVAVLHQDDTVWWVLRDVRHVLRQSPSIFPMYFAYVAEGLRTEFTTLRGWPAPARVFRCHYELPGDSSGVRWTLKELPLSPEGAPLAVAPGLDVAGPTRQLLNAVLNLSEAPRRVCL